jgi:hypothetical protein
MLSPLSSVLISKYFDGKPNIVQMSEISNMTSLSQLFKGYDHAVIFVAVNSPSDGHWQFIYKSNDELHFFDSYGMNPIELLQKMNSQNHDMYGQNFNLANLILQSPYRLKSYMNDIKYQSDGLPQTCGRYVALNFILLHIYNNKRLPYDETVFYRIMNHLKKVYKAKSYDVVISTVIDQVDLNTF